MYLFDRVQADKWCFRIRILLHTTQSDKNEFLSNRSQLDDVMKTIWVVPSHMRQFGCSPLNQYVFTLYYHVQLFPETYKAFQNEYQSEQLEFLYVEGTSLGSSQLQSQKILNSDDLSQTLFVTVFTGRVSSRLRYTAWKEPVFGVFLPRIETRKSPNTNTFHAVVVLTVEVLLFLALKIVGLFFR